MSIKGLLGYCETKGCRNLYVCKLTLDAEKSNGKRRPDAGLVHEFDIIGRLNVAPLRMCPQCLALDITELKSGMRIRQEGA